LPVPAERPRSITMWSNSPLFAAHNFSIASAWISGDTLRS
jgi:hypothetical protein